MFHNRAIAATLFYGIDLASGIAVEAVAITGDGCSFIIDSRDGARFASAIVNLNVALKFHDRLAS